MGREEIRTPLKSPAWEATIATVYQELSQPRPQGFSLKKIGKSPGDEVGAKQSRTKLKRISLKCLRVANFVENARLRRIKLVAFTKIRI